MRFGKSIGFCMALGLSLTAAGTFHDMEAAEIRIIGETRADNETDAPESETLTDASLSERSSELETAGREDDRESGIANGIEGEGGTMPDPASDSDPAVDFSFEADPLDPVEEGINAAEAVEAARTLYSQMKHYAEATDNDEFSALFEPDITAEEIQAEMKALQTSPASEKTYPKHADICYLDPTDGKADSPYYFGVALTDYTVKDDGSVEWYSTLLKVANYSEGWKISRLPKGNLLERSYASEYLNAVREGRNAMDLYPYFGLRFGDSGVFEDAFYSLIHMAWEEADGSISLSLWLANGTGGTKWCDSIEVTLNDSGLGELFSTSVPVQSSVSPGESKTVLLNVPARDVEKDGVWNSLTVQSNLFYQ